MNYKTIASIILLSSFTTALSSCTNKDETLSSKTITTKDTITKTIDTKDTVIKTDSLDESSPPPKDTQSNTTQNKTSIKTSNFDVGIGISWPKKVFAPYIDMVAWINDKDYSNSGAPNLKTISEKGDIKFFTLGFIQSTGEKATDKSIPWGFGGHALLSEASSSNSQYQGIKKSIKDVRSLGGDVSISFGGLNGTPLWMATDSVDALSNTYKEIIEGFGLSRIDLDIEGTAQDYNKNLLNAKAIKKLQETIDFKTTLTLPVLPNGLTNEGINVLKAYLSQGVDIQMVNLMTMCYGENTLKQGENYGTASLRAIDSVKEQIKPLYKEYKNITLSDKDAYNLLGTTPSIGFEGDAHPIFTTEWCNLILSHAKKNNLQMVSFWSLNRDAMLSENKGINDRYDYTKIFKDYSTT